MKTPWHVGEERAEQHPGNRSPACKGDCMRKQSLHFASFLSTRQGLKPTREGTSSVSNQWRWAETLLMHCSTRSFCYDNLLRLEGNGSHFKGIYSGDFTIKKTEGCTILSFLCMLLQQGSRWMLSHHGATGAFLLEALTVPAASQQQWTLVFRKTEDEYFLF